MSWIIQSLLNERNQIREKADISSDQYNDLIVIEKGIEEMTEKHLLTEKELETIKEASDSVAELGKKPNYYQTRGLNKKYKEVCERLAEYLGDYFTDEGYVEYMRDKYKLTDVQVETLQNYMKSSYRHKLARKGSATGYSYTYSKQGTTND